MAQNELDFWKPSAHPCSYKSQRWVAAERSWVAAERSPSAGNQRRRKTGADFEVWRRTHKFIGEVWHCLLLLSINDRSFASHAESGCFYMSTPLTKPKHCWGRCLTFCFCFEHRWGEVGTLKKQCRANVSMNVNSTNTQPLALILLIYIRTRSKYCHHHA